VAVLFLVLMTNALFQQPFDLAMAGFAFFCTLTGYNFVKYEVYFRNNLPLRKQLKVILMLSAFSMLVSTCFFFLLKFITQLAKLLFFGLTILYTVPVFSTKKNRRNWSGIKIYIVAFCWAGVTTLLPMLNFEIESHQDILSNFVSDFY